MNASNHPSTTSGGTPLTRGQSKFCSLIIIACVLCMFLVPAMAESTLRIIKSRHTVTEATLFHPAIEIGIALSNFWYVVLLGLAGIFFLWARRTRVRTLAFHAVLCVVFPLMIWFCTQTYMQQMNLMQEELRQRNEPPPVE